MGHGLSKTSILPKIRNATLTFKSIHEKLEKEVYYKKTKMELYTTYGSGVGST
jgi:hypothetical protein